MIDLIDTCKTYPIHRGCAQKLALDRVNLHINPGEKSGILGRNGVGNSTPIHIINGYDRPYSGKIVKTMPVSSPLAFCDSFQGSLTGHDNARLISRAYNVHFHKAIEAVEDFAELGTYLNEPVKTY